MKKILVILALQACSDPTVQLPVTDVHNGNDINSKLGTNTTQSSLKADTDIVNP
jgi:hypothetical protein